MLSLLIQYDLLVQHFFIFLGYISFLIPCGGGNWVAVLKNTLGKATLINLLLLSAIVSNLGQYLVSGANFGGLSGVVYALVGFVWWFGYLAPERGLSLSKPLVGFLLFWLVLGFADLLPVNVANTAHLLGLLSGCFLALFTVKFIGKSAKNKGS